MISSFNEKILITAALPYANGAIHFGHLAGAYLPADCYSRYMKAMGHDVCFICGSDEYGVAIALSADMQNRTPKEHVDIFHEVNKKLFEDLLISFDHYSRTTAAEHAQTTIEFFTPLHHKGYITPAESEQLFCPEDNKFYADRYVVGICPKCGFDKARGDECTRCGASYEAIDLKEPRTKIANKELVRKKTIHWYLRLDLFKDQLMKWIDTKASWKPNVVNFIKSYIEDLRPRAITRDMVWGIPVPLPEAKNKVFYVWFDAPIGYISATKEWAQRSGEENKWKNYWLDPKTKLVQFIGKDNIPFHSVIFPAMLMGQDLAYKIVDELPANEFYTLQGKQFSKSDGWYIDVQEFLQEFSPELIRYTIASNAPETQDAEFTWKDFQTKVNADLVGKFGNFIHRTLVFAKNICQGKIPLKSATFDAKDIEFVHAMHEKVSAIQEAYSHFRLRRACQLIMELSQIGNIYFDIKKPWAAAKKNVLHTEAEIAAMHTTIALCIDCVKFLSIVCEPVLPISCKKIEDMLGLSSVCNALHEKYSETTWNNKIAWQLEGGMQLNEPQILFKKIEDEIIQKHEERLISSSHSNKVTYSSFMNQNSTCATAQQNSQQKTQDELAVATKKDTNSTTKEGNISQKAMIDFDDFEKIDLEVVEIIAAEPILKSTKLLRLEVMTKMGKKQIVSGIALSYTPQDLIGKKVVACVNLKPAKLMGIESQGMILAASKESGIELIEVTAAHAGASVK